MTKANLKLAPPPPKVSSQPTVPRKLSPEAQEKYKAIAAQFHIVDAASLLLLEVAMRAFDALNAADKEVAKEGAFLRGRRHPAAVAKERASNTMLKCLKALKLER